MPNYPIDYLTEEEATVPSPEVLYHYSSWPGVFSILSNKTLRMRHSGYLNDKHEMLEGISLIQHVLETTAASGNEKWGPHWARVREDWLKDFSDTNVFLASFCEKGDTLDLWRAYVKDGGAAIGFSSKHLRKSADERALWLLPCLYQRSIRSERIFEIVDYFTHNYWRPWEGDVEQFSDAVCGDLLLEIPRQKSEHFLSENEWRLFVFGNTIDQGETVKFSVSSRGIVPHLDFAFTPEMIVELVTDPYATPEAILGLEEFLGRSGFEHVAVRRSEVPLRP
ncbi:MAG: DUF2971 domain-containing protein [Rhizomicrobium sp.]